MEDAGNGILCSVQRNASLLQQHATWVSGLGYWIVTWVNLEVVNYLGYTALVCPLVRIPGCREVSLDSFLPQGYQGERLP